MTDILRKLGLGTEGYENPLDENAEGFVATGDESETASAAILEATRESAEVDAAEQDAENIDEAVEDLEDQAELGEVAVESNQYTPMVAEMQRIGVKSALSKIVGMPVAKKVVDGNLLPARESFDADPNGAGTLATESIKDTIREFWAAIKAQFKKVMDKIKDWFNSTIAAAPRLKARAAKIQKRAENTTGTAKAKIKVSSASSIHVNGALGDAAVSGFGELLAKSKEVLTVAKTEAADKASKGVLDAVEKAAKAKTTTKAENMLSGVKVTDAIVAFSGGTAPETTSTFGGKDEISVTATKELPGGVQLVTITGKGDAKEIVKRTRNAKVEARKKQPDLAGKEFPALTLPVIDKLMDKVQEGCEVIIDYKKASNKIDQYQNDIISAGDKATGSIDKDIDSTTQREIRTLIQAAVGLFRRAIVFRKDVAQLVLSTGGGFCTYAEASLSSYKEKQD